ncbi:hypothetical protein [[Mycobacterium] nativiensis]|uniref:UsfY protein n=1 Tax=[Mycobacterium] nativiensis TaxID=2855503 RepID=A0ABU5XZK0_9MYCO|nr:hypothetical protein [Mycolicibacter sp. MYC340]MEB3033192.1 hypothetical protein [Mycolicibacter sp. MYC340]
MTDTDDPIDQARTTQPRAGMVFKDRRELPGLAMLVMATLALVAFMSAAAQASVGWALGFGITVLVLAVSGVTWMFVGRNRAAHASHGGHHRRQT